MRFIPQIYFNKDNYVHKYGGKKLKIKQGHIWLGHEKMK